MTGVNDEVEELIISNPGICVYDSQRRNSFTDEMVQIVREKETNFKSEDVEFLGIGRSSHSVQLAAVKLGKKRNGADKRDMDSDNQKKSDRVKGPRQLVDSVHLATLAASYHQRFAEYSQNRKQSVQQQIPKKVWDLVYQDYLQVHPDSSFGEETLKQRLRECVNELETGTANEKNGPATLQSDELLRRIKETNGHASRNILQKRKLILEGGSLPQPQMKKSSPSLSAATQESTGASMKTGTTSKSDAATATNSVVTSHVKGKGPKLITKVALMRKQIGALEKLALEFQASTAEQKNYLKLKNLKLLLETGVITQEEFSVQAKQLMGM